MIILDTNVVSEPLKAAPDARVLQWLDRQAVDTLHLTTIAVAELRYAVAVLPAGRRRDVLATRLEGDVLPLFAGRILDVDLAAAHAYGEIRAAARRRGEPIGNLDAMIAASLVPTAVSSPPETPPRSSQPGWR